MKPEKFTPNSVSQDGFLLQEACYKITGCAIDILNGLGPGLDENVYKNCLKIEMARRGIAYRSDVAFPLVYGGEKVGEASVPFVVSDCLVVACVVTERFNETDYSCFLSYLRALNLPMALLLNFQFGKLQWRKIVW